MVLEEFVFDGVDEGEVGCFDEIGGDTHRGPFMLVVPGFDEDADFGGGPRGGVHDADFIVRERHLLQSRVKLLE